MTFLYPLLYLKCLPPKLLMNAESPLLVTESVTIVLPGYFLHRSSNVFPGAKPTELDFSSRLKTQK